MTNTFIILDSSALVSLYNAQDSNHKRAVEISQALEKHSHTFILPMGVFAETMNVLGRRHTHNLIVQNFALPLLQSDSYTFVEAPTDIVRRAIELFSLLGQSVSYVDCLVMTFAQHFNTKTIFGFDECFAKAGYHLPKSLLS